MLRIRRINRLTGRTSKGFTVVEMTMVVMILGLILPVFSVMLINTYRDSFYAKDKVRITADTVQALRYIEDTTRQAKTFRATVPSAYTDTYGRNNAGTAGGEAWSYKGDSAAIRVLITENYSSNANPLNTGRQPVFIDTPAFNCTTEMYYQPQLTYIAIYFVRNNTLYKRLLTDTTTALCAGNTQQQKQTCPPDVTQSSWPAACQANDEVLASNVSSFSTAFYRISQDGISTQIDPTFTSSDPSILASADYVNVTITTSVLNGAVTNTMTQRITKVNQ